MRKIINSTYISLDGVIENPDWPVGSSDGQAYQVQTGLLLTCDALLMGRRTYNGFAPVWPTQSGDPCSDQINAMPKYVVSSTLQDPKWNNTTVIAGDPVPQIRQLKNQPGKDIVQYGFGQLSYTLMEHGLLDELRLWVHPVFVGSGGPQDLLYRDSKLTQFDLTGTTTLSNGIAILHYKVKPAEATAD